MLADRREFGFAWVGLCARVICDMTMFVVAIVAVGEN